MAGTTVTNTGTTTIGGDAGGNVGVSTGSAVTGLLPADISNGDIHKNDAVAIQAQVDLVTAYNDAAGRTVTANMTDQDLGGKTLTSGVYKFDSEAGLTGTLTLDAENDPDAVFIFQIGSALTTASSSSVSLVNGARYCRVFWQVGSSATLGTGSEFVGHLFALTSIAAQTKATIQGQLLARNGAVTLDNNVITNGVCASETTTPPTEIVPPDSDISPTPVTAPDSDITPTPATGPDSDMTPTPTAASDSDIIATPTTAPDSDMTPTLTEAPILIVTGTSTDDEIPKTGESSNYTLIVLLLLGAIVSLALYLRRKRAR